MLAALRAAPIALAVLAGVGVACTTEVRQPCSGACGPGTECVNDRCEAVAPPVLDEPAGKRKRKGKRGRRGAAAGGAAAGDDAAAGVGDPPGEALPPFVPANL